MKFQIDLLSDKLSIYFPDDSFVQIVSLDLKNQIIKLAMILKLCFFIRHATVGNFKEKDYIFSCVFKLFCSIVNYRKGKPIARWGRKVMDPAARGRQTAEVILLWQFLFFESDSPVGYKNACFFDRLIYSTEVG